MNNRFYIELDNGENYAFEINFNLDKYKIKKGYLYKKHKKLGKIARVYEDYQPIEPNSNLMFVIANKIIQNKNCSYAEAVEIIDRVKDFRCMSEYYPMYEKTQYKVIFEVEEK